MKYLTYWMIGHFAVGQFWWLNILSQPWYIGLLFDEIGVGYLGMILRDSKRTQHKRLEVEGESGETRDNEER